MGLIPVKQCKRSVKPVLSPPDCGNFGRMNRIVFRNFGLIGMISLAGVLAIRAVTLEQQSRREAERFSEQVNLALRFTAHRLLVLAGDRKSAIPPVQEDEPGTWLIRMEQNFNYDSLPPILSRAFELHRIEGRYNVSVVNCQTDYLTLGYAANTTQASMEVPCGGREQTAGCYNLRVSFPDRNTMAAEAGQNWLWVIALAFILAIYSVYIGFRNLKNRRIANKYSGAPPDNVSEKTVAELPMLLFGQSALDISNQKLFVKGEAKDLTYREAKLLQFFCRHTGQLLSRDLILQSVWGDEGILVGRSVDVFVSRLRKLLKSDDTVRIANVHGIGYRLDVS